MKLGAYPSVSLAEARLQAKAVLGKAALGSDPQGERQSGEAGTFDELAEEYMERHARRKKRSWREDERMIEKELLPSWGSRRSTEISRREVIALLDRIVDRGAPVLANRVRALISKTFNFGIARGIVESNPAHLVERPSEEHPRQNVLSESDIRAVWAALAEQHPVVAAIYRLRLLTAQRGIEIRSMRWSDIEADWWTIPANVAKNGLQHRVPLSPPVLSLLQELKPLTGEAEWVLESPRKSGARLGKLQKATERIRKVSAVDFVPHDLRRTAASQMTSMGTPRLVVKKILNHAERDVTAVYDRHSYDPEKRRALLSWGARLTTILGDRKIETVVRIA